MSFDSADPTDLHETDVNSRPLHRGDPDHAHIRPDRIWRDPRYSNLKTAVFARIPYRETGSVPDSAPRPADLCGLYLDWLGARRPPTDRIYLDETPPWEAGRRGWLQLLEDLEFGKFDVLVVPNLEHIWDRISDPYKFYVWCTQQDIELHTVDRGRTSIADFAMHAFVGREDLTDRPGAAVRRLDLREHAFGEARERPTCDAAQLSRLVGGEIRGPSGSVIRLLPAAGDGTIVLRDRSEVFVVDGRELEEGLLGAMLDALRASGHLDPTPIVDVEAYAGRAPAWHCPKSPLEGRSRVDPDDAAHASPGPVGRDEMVRARGRLCRVLYEGQDVIVAPLPGFGRLNSEDCRTVRTSIASLELHLDDRGVPRFRLVSGPELRFRARLFAAETLKAFVPAPWPDVGGGIAAGRGPSGCLVPAWERRRRSLPSRRR